MAKETGSPAFPGMEVTEYGSGPRVDYFTGMTLRDYFAAKAMAALMLAYMSGNDPLKIPVQAYQMADLMIAERAK